MPYLTVLGLGSWRHKKTRYESGVHQVDAETAEAALAMRNRNLLVTDEEPTLAAESSSGMLTRDDVKVNRRVGAEIVSEDTATETEEAHIIEVPFDFECSDCPKSFPSAPARDRHREFHHEA